MCLQMIQFCSFLMAKQYSTVHLYHIHFIHSPVKVHLPLSCIRALGTQMPAFALGRIVLITGTPSWEPCSSIWAPAAFCGLGHPDTPSEAGFLNLSTVDFGGWIILCGKAHPVHFRRYSKQLPVSGAPGPAGGAAVLQQASFLARGSPGGHGCPPLRPPAPSTQIPLGSVENWKSRTPADPSPPPGPLMEWGSHPGQEGSIPPAQ